VQGLKWEVLGLNLHRCIFFYPINTTLIPVVGTRTKNTLGRLEEVAAGRKRRDLQLLLALLFMAKRLFGGGTVSGRELVGGTCTQAEERGIAGFKASAGSSPHCSSPMQGRALEFCLTMMEETLERIQKR
jgi:hypothetical protein